MNRKSQLAQLAREREKVRRLQNCEKPIDQKLVNRRCKFCQSSLTGSCILSHEGICDRCATQAFNILLGGKI